MNSVVKLATFQSHRLTRRWVASHSFFYSTKTNRPTKLAKPTDSKHPAAAPPPKECPKPSTIPYQSKVANTVSFSGYIHKPVQFEAAPDGKFLARTVISQDSSCNAPTLWIPITFEGDLAHVAVFHVKENDHVYIDGQLSVDPPSGATRNQSNVQVMVRSINFVDKSPPKKKSDAHPKEEMTLTYSARTKGGTDIAVDAWKDLLDNPKEWKDYRQSKLNGLVKPNYPDFKCKDGVRALWLKGGPKWVVSRLEGVEFDIPSNKSIPIKKSRDDPWKDLVENPSMWWDNRLDKINGKVKEKFPDFKHRENGTALWVSDLPTWAESKLPPLKSKIWDRNP